MAQILIVQEVTITISTHFLWSLPSPASVFLHSWKKKKKTQNFKNSKTRVPFIARESIVPRVEKFIQDSQAPPQTN